jgi:hypothetical protein
LNLRWTRALGPDDEIWAQTERVCRADPSFMPMRDWQERFPAPQ